MTTPDDTVGARIQQAWRSASHPRPERPGWSMIWVSLINTIHTLDLTEHDVARWPQPAEEITLEGLIAGSHDPGGPDDVEDRVLRELGIPDAPGSLRAWILRHTPRLRSSAQ